MKIVGILLGLVLLAVPLSADGITISQIEKKLSQAQSQEDVEKVITEIVTSKEYQEACKQLSNKISSLPPPEKTQAYLDKALPLLQDYENLKCNYTKRIWGDPPEQLSKTQCDELIVKFEEYNERYWNIDKERLRIFSIDGLDASHEYLDTSEWWYLEDLKRETKEEYRHKCIPDPEQCDVLQQDTTDLSRTDRKILEDRYSLTCGYISSLMQYYEAQEKYLGISKPTIVSSSEILCGKGTIENAYGQCVLDTKSSKGGGCLIATATYGSELAPQVQMLREIRDNSLLQTQSGNTFMKSFNSFYYSFSPTIADYERQNPAFKEAVKLTITPLLTSLSLLNHVDLDSEESVLGYGIGIILMNVGMYFVAPAIVILKIRNKI